MQSFILPCTTITDADIKSGILPVTKDFEEHFPSTSSEIKIDYGKRIVKDVRFEYREGKDHRLHVGRPFMINMEIGPGSKLKFLIVKAKTFYIIYKT